MSEKNLQRVLLACFLLLTTAAVFLRSGSGIPAVLSQNEPVFVSGDTVSTETTPALLNRNLNTASADDLLCVDGIGRKLADAVIAHREKIGGYTHRSQLCGAEGIGEALAGRIMEVFYIPNEHLPETTSPPAEPAPPETTNPTAQATEPFIRERDLNLADASDLLCVPGIGEHLAAEILAYRAAIGGFSRRSQLLEIPGIGELLAGRIMGEFYIPNEQPEPVPEPPPAQPGTTPAPEETAPPVTAPESPLDLNTATREELLAIPGMTEKIADSLLALRELIGHFSSIYETLYAEEVTDTVFREMIQVWLYVPAEETTETRTQETTSCADLPL